MATTTVNFVFQDADLAAIIPILCQAWGLPVSNANAKQAIILYLKDLYTKNKGNADALAAAQSANAAAAAVASAIIVT